MTRSKIFDCHSNKYEFIEYLELAITMVTRIQILFVFIWMVVGGLSPSMIDVLLKPLYPSTQLISSYYPKIGHMYFGLLSSDFYQAISIETFFVASIQFIFIASLYVARYWNKPWRLFEFISERMGFEFFSIGMFIFLAFSIFIFVGLWMIGPYYYGVYSFPGEIKPIKIFQLGLWSIVASVGPLLFVLLFFILISFIFLSIKSALKLFR